MQLAQSAFKMWRSQDGNLKEAQSKFTFKDVLDMSAVKGVLSNHIKLAVLEGVDPSPNNICAAGALNCKGAPAPPAAGAKYSLLRLEIIPDYAPGPDGSKRAASRLTVRATDQALADSINQSLTAHLSM